MVARVALLLAFVAAASGNPAAGKPWHWKSPKPLVDARGPAPNGGSRIVGGIEAVPHSWPHQAALFIDDMYFCGGSLLSSGVVLTGRSLHGTGSAGAHNSAENEASQVSIVSTDFFTHENWNSWLLTHDIAIIRLPPPLISWRQRYLQPVLRQVDVPIMTNAGLGDSARSLNLNGMDLRHHSFGAPAGIPYPIPATLPKSTDLGKKGDEPKGSTVPSRGWNVLPAGQTCTSIQLLLENIDKESRSVCGKRTKIREAKLDHSGTIKQNGREKNVEKK
ncbi:chymotrypsin BI-like [Penaeus indicus]|uniref:chymotrypsin BI-like n=1 Tax=Penaeus indicus TaxID=29960 RepID=UPI00300D36DB